MLLITPQCQQIVIYHENVEMLSIFLAFLFKCIINKFLYAYGNNCMRNKTPIDQTTVIF